PAILSALIHTRYASPKNKRPQTRSTKRRKSKRPLLPSAMSMKSSVTCSSARDASGSPAKISVSSNSSVISKAPRIGQFKMYRPTTSAVVNAIRQNSRMAAAVPSTRSSKTTASEGCDDLIESGRLLPSCYPLRLLAEFCQHLGAVDALGGGVLDPFVVDRLGALLHALN